MKPSTSKPHGSDASRSEVQGEGDYDSAEKYNEETREFIDSGRVEQAARNAAPRNEEERQAMRKAEEEGRSHARGEGKQAQDGKSPGRGKPAKQAPGKNPQSKPVPEKAPGR